VAGDLSVSPQDEAPTVKDVERRVMLPREHQRIVPPRGNRARLSTDDKTAAEADTVDTVRALAAVVGREAG